MTQVQITVTYTPIKTHASINLYFVISVGWVQDHLYK